jgi:hypothetical protein
VEDGLKGQYNVNSGKTWSEVTVTEMNLRIAVGIILTLFRECAHPLEFSYA